MVENKKRRTKRAAQSKNKKKTKSCQGGTLMSEIKFLLLFVVVYVIVRQIMRKVTNY